MLKTELISLTHDELMDLIQKAIKMASSQNVQPEQKPAPSTKAILTINEVCEMLDVTRQTINLWVKKRILTAHRMMRRVYFFASEVHDALNKGVIKPRSR